MSDQLEHVVRAAGVLAPVAYVLVYTALTVLFVPGSLLTVAAGALFGAVLGSVLTVLGATLGALAAFAIARRLGRERLESRLGDRMRAADRWLTGRGLRAMLALRLLPVIPFNALNYAAGLSGIAARDYALATVVGIVPGTVAYVALGNSLRDPGSTGFWASLGAVVALVVVSSLASRRRPPAPEPEPRAEPGA